MYLYISIIYIDWFLTSATTTTTTTRMWLTCKFGNVTTQPVFRIICTFTTQLLLHRTHVRANSNYTQFSYIIDSAICSVYHIIFIIYIQSIYTFLCILDEEEHIHTYIGRCLLATLLYLNKKQAIKIKREKIMFEKGGIN